MTIKDDILSELKTGLKSNTIKSASDELYSDIPYFISTGITVLDAYLRGGHPGGRCTEIYAKWGLGKSTLAMMALANCQRRSGIASLIETENSFDKIRASQLGVNMDDLIVYAPLKVEAGFDYISSFIDILSTKRELRGKNQLITNNTPSMLAWDTVSNAANEKELDNDSGGMTKTPRLIKEWLRKSTIPLGIAKTFMLYICQSISNVGNAYYTESSGTGWGIKFLVTHRLHLMEGAQIKIDNERIGKTIKIIIEKNKLDRDGIMFEIPFKYSCGFDDKESVLQFLINSSVIDQKGGWYYYKKFRSQETESFRFKDLLELFNNDEEQYNFGKCLVWAIVHPELSSIISRLITGDCNLKNDEYGNSLVRFTIGKKEYSFHINEMLMNYLKDDELRKNLSK